MLIKDLSLVFLYGTGNQRFKLQSTFQIIKQKVKSVHSVKIVFKLPN